MPPIDFNGLDTAVHGPLRLGVLTSLVMDGPLDFTTLKKRLKASDGALGQHLQTLQDAGYIACDKRFVGRRPRSTYSITRAGRAAFARYLGAMQEVIDCVQKSSRN